MPLILFNKPYQVMCQFSIDVAHPDRSTLADYLDFPGIYPAGRLDADSEGLMLLTDDGKLQHKISHPKHKQAKIYLVQIEGRPDAIQLERLRQPLDLGDFITQGGTVKQVQEPAWLWSRHPAIRERQHHPTSWLTLKITEGKNRQIRRMTAAVGLPTLRLVRIAIGPYALDTHPLMPGEWKVVNGAALEYKTDKELTRK